MLNRIKNRLGLNFGQLHQELFTIEIKLFIMIENFINYKLNI